MMIRSIKIFFVFLLSNLLIAPAHSQDRVEESDVQLEQRFIEANLQKILGNYDQAIAIYEEIQKKDRKNDAAAYELARIYDIISDGDKAIRSIKSAINLAPDNLWYKKFLADLYQKTGRNAEAADLYEDMVKMAPDNEQLYYRWAYFLVKANDLNQALKVYDQLEARAGLNEEIIRHKHTLYLGLGNAKKAGRELERLIEAFPHELEYRHLLAEFHLQTGEENAAQKVYRQILEIDPEDAKATLALASKNSGRKNTAQGLAAQFRPVFEQPEVNIDLKIGQVMPFIQEVANSGNAALAEEVLQLTSILERVHPNEAKGYAASGDLLYYTGRQAEALKKYRKTLELDDTVYLVWEQVMYIQHESRNYEELRSVSQEVMDLFPNKARAYYFNGVANHELGDPDEAVSMLEQALIMAGNDGRLVFDIQAQLGLSYAQLDQLNSARQAFEAALALNARAPMVLNNYSYLLAQRGEQLDKALDMIKQANQLAPDQPLFQDTYGWVLYKTQDYKKAKEWTAKALESGGEDNPNILEHYGDILFQLEEKDAAIEFWQKALDGGSRSKLLQKKIADRQLYE